MEEAIQHGRSRKAPTQTRQSQEQPDRKTKNKPKRKRAKHRQSPNKAAPTTGQKPEQPKQLFNADKFLGGKVASETSLEVAIESAGPKSAPVQAASATVPAPVHKENFEIPVCKPKLSTR